MATISTQLSNPFREHFLLDPSVVFLNHGSFGACPTPVFEAYQRWQRELERQPVEFMGRRHDALLKDARKKLGAYLNADPDALFFVPNATSGLNTVIRSLDLREGDEILGNDHEYGALEKTWAYICGKTGARYVKRPIPLPVTTAEEFVEAFWAGVTPRTKIVFLSHITSPTALIFPIAPIIERARAAGILSIIDGAHAPGQIPLDLTALGADFYSGNCHKWLCSPKGAAFVYVRPDFQDWIDPLTISWGWDADRAQSSYLQRNEWQGTRDIAAFLSVPAAIDFQAAHNWAVVRQQCHALVSETRGRLTALTGLAPISPDSAEWYGQMATIPLPPCDVEALKVQLYDLYRIEVPLMTFGGRQYVRISCQAYNTRADYDCLIDALCALLNIGG
jgi:isopenicillin-N epimerase